MNEEDFNKTLEGLTKAWDSSGLTASFKELTTAATSVVESVVSFATEAVKQFESEEDSLTNVLRAEYKDVEEYLEKVTAYLTRDDKLDTYFSKGYDSDNED